MVVTSEYATVTRPSAGGRKSIRYVAAAMSGIVGVLYLILLFLVAEAESVPGATDSSTYGAYLFLAVPYLVGAGLLAALDRRALWAVGAAVQVLVIALFVIFGVGVLGLGVFEYEALRELRMQLWAAGITGAQVILFGVLCYLAFTPIPLRAAPRPPASPGAGAPS